MFIALLFVMVSSLVQAQEFYCSDWAEQGNLTCIHAGRSAKVWARQCENPCDFRNYGPHCDLDRMCLNENPNDLTTVCSRWVKESGMTCHNPNTGRWEQKWVRACQRGLAMTWCSDKDPNRD